MFNEEYSWRHMAQLWLWLLEILKPFCLAFFLFIFISIFTIFSVPFYKLVSAIILSRTCINTCRFSFANTYKHINSTRYIQTCILISSPLPRVWHEDSSPLPWCIFWVTIHTIQSDRFLRGTTCTRQLERAPQPLGNDTITGLRSSAPNPRAGNFSPHLLPPDLLPPLIIITRPLLYIFTSRHFIFPHYYSTFNEITNSSKLCNLFLILLQIIRVSAGRNN